MVRNQKWNENQQRSRKTLKISKARMEKWKTKNSIENENCFIVLSSLKIVKENVHEVFQRKYNKSYKLTVAVEVKFALGY